MEDRLKKFMEYKGISPSELADSIGVQRSNVTHVLKGRNRPSFQFMEKFFQVYPEINAKWFLNGEGNMLEGTSKMKEESSKSRSLFDSFTEPAVNQTEPVIPVINKVITEKKFEAESAKDSYVSAPKEIISTPPLADKKESENELYDPFFGSEKPIERLIVFFKDQTFKVYNLSR